MSFNRGEYSALRLRLRAPATAVSSNLSAPPPPPRTLCTPDNNPPSPPPATLSGNDAPRGRSSRAGSGTEAQRRDGADRREADAEGAAATPKLPQWDRARGGRTRRARLRLQAARRLRGCASPSAQNFTRSPNLFRPTWGRYMPPPNLTPARLVATRRTATRRLHPRSTIRRHTTRSSRCENP